MPEYLHGVETVIVESGPTPIQVVKSGVIGLIGLAPIGPVNELTLVTGETAAAQFGDELPGFDIPKALAAIFAQGYGTVLVINVFDDVDNVDTITAEAHVVTDLKIRTTYAPTNPGTLIVKDVTGVTTYVNGTDYECDSFGRITILATIVEGATIKVTYKRLATATVVPSQFEGDIVSGVRTGAKLWDLAYNRFSFRPKLFIAPGYSNDVDIRNVLLVAAEKFKGYALIDGDAGWTPTEAITDRGVGGTVFNTSSKRAFLLSPGVFDYDAYTDEDETRPASAYIAGLIARVDAQEGYWVSPSNHEIAGITSAERVIEWALNDANCEANLMNAAGIATLVAGFGTGTRLMGNRSASWPTNTAPDNFLCVARTADIVDESCEYAMLRYLDKPLNRATINAIVESVNAFIRTQIQRGALVEGSKCKYIAAENPATELALGHLTLNVDLMGPTPAERITFKRFLNINLLTNVQ